MQKRRFVSYIRVSTDKQGKSGLGLDAQQAAVAAYLQGVNGGLIAEFREVESGKSNYRPELAKALALCEERKAVLVIAKLDRLSRNLAFIANLMESAISFVACDLKDANRMTLQVMAVFAEHEGKMISERTTAALKAAKARGVTLGNPSNLLTARANSLKVRAARADGYAARLKPVIDSYARAGITGLSEIAMRLNAREERTPGGKRKWRAETVRRLIARVA